MPAGRARFPEFRGDRGSDRGDRLDRDLLASVALAQARRALARLPDITGRRFQVRSEDGFELHARLHRARRSRACIVLCHGITADCRENGMFTRFARAATRRGFNVIRFDFRGHGRSAGTDRDFLISGQRLDLAAVLAHARGLDLDPRYLIGMSFGASPVVSELAGPTSYPGLVLWSPAVDYARTCLQPNTPWAREILASRDHATLPDWAFARIPGSGFLISKELAAEAEADRTAAVLRATRAPVLAFSAIDDEKAPYEPLAEVAAANASIDVRRIPGEHSLAEGRPRVIWETLDWIEDRASSRG